MQHNITGWRICSWIQRINGTDHSKGRRTYSPKLPTTKSTSHDFIISSRGSSSIFNRIT